MSNEDAINDLSQQVTECIDELKNVGPSAVRFRYELLNLLSDIQARVANCARAQMAISALSSETAQGQEKAVPPSGKKNEIAIERINDDIRDCNERKETIEKSRKNTEEQIIRLTEENASMKEHLNMGSGWTAEQEATRKGLITRIEIERNEVDDAKSALSTIRSQVLDLGEQMRDREGKRDAEFAEIDTVEAQIESIQKEIHAEQHRRNFLEDDLQQLQKKIQEKRADISDKECFLKTEKEDVTSIAHLAADLKTQLDSSCALYESLLREKQMCGKELERETQMNKILGDQNIHRPKLVDQNKDEFKIVSKDFAKIRKQCEMITEQKLEVKKQRISCE